MIDLNDLRTFERVGSLLSFSAASAALSQPKSTISRSIARLEAAVGARLFQRTTREVVLTPAGEALMERCVVALRQLTSATDFVAHLAEQPSGMLNVSSGIGFGVNVLALQLPAFLQSYPSIRVHLDLTSRAAELVADRVDVAIRFGPLADSSLVVARLGEMKRVLCASPAYIARCGTACEPHDLSGHDLIEMPNWDAKPRFWTFVREARRVEVEVKPRICVNDALTIHRLIVNGAGIGIVSHYLCAPDIATGRLVQLLPDWTLPAVDVNMLFPSRRELAPIVRAFVDYMKESNPPGLHWQDNGPTVSTAAVPSADRTSDA